MEPELILYWKARSLLTLKDELLLYGNHISLHEGSKFLNRVEVDHAPRSYVYTIGILYGRISTWRTEQLVNSSRRYVSATPVRRLLSHELVKTTIL